MGFDVRCAGWFNVACVRFGWGSVEKKGKKNNNNFMILILGQNLATN